MLNNKQLLDNFTNCVWWIRSPLSFLIRVHRNNKTLKCTGTCQWLILGSAFLGTIAPKEESLLLKCRAHKADRKTENTANQWAVHPVFCMMTLSWYSAGFCYKIKERMTRQTTFKGYDFSPAYSIDNIILNDKTESLDVLVWWNIFFGD